ncbi:MAG: efflux RND transporter periplasmic adaptor subunit [Bacteroidales bacterium]|nr:efflux RND transporter periplasmic adaptor subunit [Bacteroidales bacterium]
MTGYQLFKVVDLSRLWVLFDAYESDLPWISTGDNVEFTIQSLPGIIMWK